MKDAVAHTLAYRVGWLAERLLPKCPAPTDCCMCGARLRVEHVEKNVVAIIAEHEHFKLRAVVNSCPCCEQLGMVHITHFRGNPSKAIFWMRDSGGQEAAEPATIH